MLQYILLAIAAVTVFVIEPGLASFLSAGPMLEYAVALGVALMLKPWLSGHFE